MQVKLTLTATDVADGDKSETLAQLRERMIASMRDLLPMFVSGEQAAGVRIDVTPEDLHQAKWVTEESMSDPYVTGLVAEATVTVMEHERVKRADEPVKLPDPGTEETRTWTGILNQSLWWKPKNGAAVRIADMDPRWRYNTARWLLRHAEVIATLYTVSMACMPMPDPDSESYWGMCREIQIEIEAAAKEPVEWMRQTELWQALTEGLDEVPAPDSSPKISAERSRPDNHLRECAIRNGDTDLGCTCRDDSPEWTTG